MLSLGSIAHLQYYFARTGLLDGKGGQLAKRKQNGEYDLPVPPRLSLSGTGSDAGSSVIDSPLEEEGSFIWDPAQEYGEEVMLPPTVSTYAHRTHHLPPPPDQKSLKRDLVKALENALQLLEETAPGINNAESKASPVEEEQGFHEIQGLHILDTTTLAIRAARLYYTLHPNPVLLNSLKPDFQLRRDLISVLDVLKRWAARKFAGGLREDERLMILTWVTELATLIDQETRLEDAERQERERWQWMDSSLWSGKETDREICFLASLTGLTSSPNAYGQLPAWEHVQPGAVEPTAFLKALADGRWLVQVHNAAVKQSKRHFGQITKWHDDVAKPYRRAENIRFWIKAAEIRWEIKLTVKVMGIVNMAKDADVWRLFEDNVLKWCKVVREEIIRNWENDGHRQIHTGANYLASTSPLASPPKPDHATDTPDEHL